MAISTTIQFPRGVVGDLPTLADGQAAWTTDTHHIYVGQSGVNYLIGGTGDALTSQPLSQFASTSSSQLAGVISDETGTGALVFATDPALAGVPTAPTAGAGTNTTQIATTAFVTGAVATAVTGLLDLKGSTDCSGNPNYPAADKGDVYIVTVAGKIGGASGKSVDVGDSYIASADNAGGTEASVGTSWFVLEHNLAGALLSANNLSDVASAATSRGNLGGTTAGQSFFTLTNPSAITFPRINADNTVSALDAATFRTAIGVSASGSVQLPDTNASNYLTLAWSDNDTVDRTLSFEVASGNRTVRITGDATITGDNTGDQTSVSGNAGTVTVADAGGDTTTWVLLGTSQTGSLAPATDAGLTYNANSNALTTSFFIGALTGNATTATALATPRTIGGTSFDGTANIVPATIVVADSTDTTCFVALFEDATGSLAPKTDAGITYNASTGVLTATGFSGPLTGNVTGNASGSSGSCTGNSATVTVADAGGDTTTWVLLGTSQTGSLAQATDAALTYNATTNALTADTFVGALTGNASTATVLATARNINGVSFNGSADITVAAAAGTLTGTTLASNVVTSSITTVGTLTGGATGAGFTIALTTSTVTGNLPIANMPALNGFTDADPALTDVLPIYSAAASANRDTTVEKIGGFIHPAICDGRLTLTTGVSVTTSDVTAAGTIYFALHIGNRISLYDGTRWKLYAFTERSLSLTMTSGYVYDVFIYDNGGTLTLETAEWDNSTVTVTIATPGVVTWTAHPLSNGDQVILSTTGALPTGLAAATIYYVVNKATNTFELSATKGGASINTTGSQSGTHTAHSLNTHVTNLTTQDGVYVKSGATTRKWLGSSKASGTNTTEDSDIKRFVWNLYNREPRRLYKSAGASHTYATVAWRLWNGDSANKVEFILGIPQNIPLDIQADMGSSSASGSEYVGIGVDRSNGGDLFVQGTGTGVFQLGAALNWLFTAGYHACNMVQITTSGTGSFNTCIASGAYYA